MIAALGLDDSESGRIVWVSDINATDQVVRAIIVTSSRGLTEARVDREVMRLL